MFKAFLKNCQGIERKLKEGSFLVFRQVKFTLRIVDRSVKNLNTRFD